MGDYLGVIKGFTRSLEDSSNSICPVKHPPKNSGISDPSTLFT